jgi:hypothetical protein
MSKDITSANSSVYLFASLFPAGLKFENFSADSAWASDNYETVEHRMGVDGHMAAGYTPVEKTITFTLEANSPTLDGLDLLLQTTEVSKTPIFGQMVITLPSLKRTFTLVNCILTSFKLLPNADRVLAPREATFVCESITSLPL